MTTIFLHEESVGLIFSKKCYSYHTCKMWVEVLVVCGSTALAIVIILLILVIVISYTDILHTFLRGKIFRDLDINK